MNAELIEMGWWAGDARYPRPAFHCFTYPQPSSIEGAAIELGAARWEGAMGEFLLDYDDLRGSPDPDANLLAFFASSYKAGAGTAGWDAGLLGSGVPA